MTHARNRNVQLLAVLVDWDGKEDGECRFLVDGKNTKYVTVEPGILPKDNRTFDPILIPLIPPFPPGENEGHVSKDPLSGHTVFSHYMQSDLPGISNTWHQRRIDHLEFKQVRQPRQNIHVVTHPQFDQTLVVKFAEFPWQIPYFEAETTAYERLDSHGIGPKFIAHLTEAERVFGFVTSTLTTKGLLTPETWRPVKKVSLSYTLYVLSMATLTNIEEKAILVDLEASQRCNEKQELEAEYEQLEASLSDTAQRGVPYSEI